MPDRTSRQQATVITMIDIASQMAMQTQRIARRDVVGLGEVYLTEEEDERLRDALSHVEQAVEDLRQLRGRWPMGESTRSMRRGRTPEQETTPGL